MKKKPCPRCSGPIPNAYAEGEYSGAISRTDNRTEICSNCGTLEALEQYVSVLTPQSQWDSPQEAGNET